jgi:hypothetical protein
MTNYLAIPFHGDRHDKDPSDFLNWFLQYMGTADNKMKARNFIYYLQADSLADEWFEELGVEEKGSWEVIEVLFRKKWLKEEEISIKKSAIVENKPHTPSTISHLVEIAPEVTPTAQNQHDKSPTTPQSLTPFENGKNSKIHPTSENSPNMDIFSSQAPSFTFSDPTALSSTITTLETRPKMADFTQKHENVKKSPIYTKTMHKTSTPSVIEPTNNATRVYASPLTSNDAVLRPTTSFTSASSSHLEKPKL